MHAILVCLKIGYPEIRLSIIIIIIISSSSVLLWNHQFCGYPPSFKHTSHFCQALSLQLQRSHPQCRLQASEPDQMTTSATAVPRWFNSIERKSQEYIKSQEYQSIFASKNSTCAKSLWSWIISAKLWATSQADDCTHSAVQLKTLPLA